MDPHLLLIIAPLAAKNQITKIHCWWMMMLHAPMWNWPTRAVYRKARPWRAKPWSFISSPTWTPVLEVRSRYDLNVLEFTFPSWCWWVEILEYNSVAAEKRCGWFVSVQDGQKWSDGEGEVHSELSKWAHPQPPSWLKKSGQQRVGEVHTKQWAGAKTGSWKVLHLCTYWLNIHLKTFWHLIVRGTLLKNEEKGVVHLHRNIFQLKLPLTCLTCQLLLNYVMVLRMLDKQVLSITWVFPWYSSCPAGGVEESAGRESG